MPAITAEFVRTRRRGGYLVPASSHWADWHEEDAIRLHGLRVGGCPDEVIAAFMTRMLSWYDKPDLVGPDLVRTGDNYIDAFHLLASFGDHDAWFEDEWEKADPDGFEKAMYGSTEE